MSCSPAASGTGLAATAIPLIKASSIYGTSHGSNLGAYNDGVIQSLRTARRTSKPAQQPPPSLGPSNNASAGQTILTPAQDVLPSRTNTRPAALEDVIEETATPSSSTSSRTSSTSNNTSTPARDTSQTEHNRQLSPVVALKEAASTASSASSSTSSSSNLSRKEQYRQERAIFEMARARIWATCPQTPSGLPNELYLRSQRLVKHDKGGFQIAENVSDRALLVGYREGSRWDNRINLMKLCQGDEWYGTYAKPFLTAWAGSEGISLKAECGNVPGSSGHLNVLATRVANDKTAWRFTIGVPDARNTNTNVQEEFEWHTHRTYRLKGQDGPVDGSVLLRKSTGYAVAHLEPGVWKRDSVLAGDLMVSFLGIGQKYGGLWKIIVFVIGCCAQ